MSLVPQSLTEPERVLLPNNISRWFRSRGWDVRAHQLALLGQAQRRCSTLLVAPTGAGKTLAGFLPSLIQISARSKVEEQSPKLRTLYISPLKALTVDVARNLTIPIDEIGLNVVCETRTGDTPASKRARQRQRPPDILLTTPEQVALLLAHPDGPALFENVETVVIDELHALSTSKRGDLLSLDLARLRKISPRLMTIGLSATVARPSELRAYLVAQPTSDETTMLADLIVAPPGAKANIEVLELQEPVPWSGHSARYAIQDIYDRIRAHKLTLVFVNTRMQAELVFQELWHANDDALRIALHHGSLDVAQRRKVEAAMARGALDAVVATSTLDLGIDWGDVDLVINVGAPKGASRLTQRIGRANHTLEKPSQALLVPANRFEVLECRAALEAAHAGAQDVVHTRKGGLDVLAQHVLGMACQDPFFPVELYEEVRTAAPYSNLSRATFDRVVEFVATGGYALKTYDRFAKLRPTDDGRLRVSNGRIAQSYRLNVGTIVESPMTKVRLASAKRRTRSIPLHGGRVLGELESYFVEQLTPGDTFVLAGEVLRFEGLIENEAIATRSTDPDPMIPSYPGGKFPLSTHLAQRVREMLSDERAWRHLPEPVSEWLSLQKDNSDIPRPDEVLIETFPRANRFYLVAYPFEGRLAHQTLGMLLTRRLERSGAQPLGFVANDYGLSLWGLRDLSEMIGSDALKLSQLFDEDMLGDDLDAWLSESSLMKRTFRNTAVIAGLIERRFPGQEKTGRQVAFSTDLIYDVLRKHDPQHILLEAAWADVSSGLLDVGRLGTFLKRVKGRIRHRALERVSPLSVPILLEIGVERVGHIGRENILREAARDLVEEAMAP